jgi:acylphosphatase
MNIESITGEDVFKILKEKLAAPETEQKLAQLGLKKGEDFLYEFFAEIIRTYPDGFETLGLMSSKSLKQNLGFPGRMIEKYGTERVKEVVKKYGSDNSIYLDDILESIGRNGQDTVDEIFHKFGFENLRTISPYYKEYGEDLTRKIISACKDKGLSNRGLSCVFPFYKKLEEAKQRSVGEPKKSYEINFTGEVQDVGFRATSQDYAECFGIGCHAINLNDGSVLCKVQGQKPIVDVLIFALKKDFNVERVIIREVN